MDMIVCPRCLGLFRTFYQEHKQERCPYCAFTVVHSQRLLDLAPKAYRTGAPVAEFHQWVKGSLGLLGVWWGEQQIVDTDRLDVLIRELEGICREAAHIRRQLTQRKMEE